VPPKDGGGISIRPRSPLACHRSVEYALCHRNPVDLLRKRGVLDQRGTDTSQTVAWLGAVDKLVRLNGVAQKQQTMRSPYLQVRRFVVFRSIDPRGCRSV
jgi:hypothetical protein